MHLRKVSITNTNDDHGDWKFRGNDQLLNCIFKVIDHTVGDDERNVVLLFPLRLLFHVQLNDAIDCGQKVMELGVAPELDLADGVVVRIEYPLDTTALRFEKVTVHCKAVAAAALI